MTVYDCVLAALTAVPPEEWDHALYYEHSSATINGVRMVLYKSGSIGFAGKIYNQSFFDILGVLFGSSRGKALFKKVRDTKKFPTSKEMWALQELSKLGFCEGHDDDE